MSANASSADVLFPRCFYVRSDNQDGKKPSLRIIHCIYSSDPYGAVDGI